MTTVAAALAIALGGGLVMAYPDANIASPPISANSDQRYQGPMNFSELVERVKPAVVNISTTGTMKLAKSMDHAFKLPNLPEGSPFGDMFQHFFESTPGQSHGGDRQVEQRAAGSGFIISATGYMVTSNHVIEHADEIEVILDDGTRYPAKLKGRDPKTDLALLKVEADKALPFVELGDSDGAKIGEWVVAVGNPFGLGGTVTAGIISARGRDLRSGPYDDYLQVDAPINRGNSGGPLFDTGGNVIGINTAIYSPTGGSVGIGFAVPASTAKDIIAQLRAEGRIERGWLGVQIQPVTQEVEESFDLPDQHGALVASVVPDSPAAKAGMQPGDVIYKMNDERLDGFKDLSKRVASTPVGTDVRFEIWRKGEARTLTAKLEIMPSEEPKLASNEIEAPEDSAKLGIYLAELTPQARKRFGISGQSSGVLVADVEQDSPAAKAGIRSGSVIEMVDQTAVNSPDELATKVQEAAAEDRSSVLLLVAYDGEKRFVAVQFAAA
jgi:serine protease Do